MSKEMKSLRALSEKGLIKRKKEIESLMVGCHKGVKPIVKIEKTKNLKITLARINTLLKENEINKRPNK